MSFNIGNSMHDYWLTMIDWHKYMNVEWFGGEIKTKRNNNISSSLLSIDFSFLHHVQFCTHSQYVEADHEIKNIWRCYFEFLTIIFMDTKCYDTFKCYYYNILHILLNKTHWSQRCSAYETPTITIKYQINI